MIYSDKKLNKMLQLCTPRLMLALYPTDTHLTHQQQTAFEKIVEK